MAAEECQIRQNYHTDSEAAMNRQINIELHASYIYLSMSSYFSRDDVALKNFAKFFREQSHEEREHAEKFMRYQNQRGGRVLLKDIKAPEKGDWTNGLEAVELALQLEKNVNQSLLELHDIATKNKDPAMCEFLEREYLGEQVEAIKKLGDFVTNLTRLGVPSNGVGEYLFDKLTLKDEGAD